MGHIPVDNVLLETVKVDLAVAEEWRRDRCVYTFKARRNTSFRDKGSYKTI